MPGLLDGVLAAANQQEPQRGGLLGGLGSWGSFDPRADHPLVRNQNALMLAGMGMLSGQDRASGWGGAMQGFVSGAQMDRASQKELLRKKAVAAARGPDGAMDYAKLAAALAEAGDTEGAASMARIAETSRYRADMVANQNRAFKLQESRAGLPDGFERKVDGSVAPMPGYIEAATAKTLATRPPRELSPSDLAKLQDQGGRWREARTLSDSFRDSFAGRGLLGDRMSAEAANAIVQSPIGALATKDARDAAEFWQAYQSRVNDVRHDKFGAALSVQEKNEWMKEEVHPGMSADTVKRKLARQDQILTEALKRHAIGLTKQGFKPDAVMGGFGVSADDLMKPSRLQGSSGMRLPGSMRRYNPETGRIE